jgi:hypothetical protein
MSAFDPLQEILVLFLLFTITLFCPTSQPAKIIGNLPEQINHLGFEMGHI